jgi:predicted acetyltransferase
VVSGKSLAKSSREAYYGVVTIASDGDQRLTIRTLTDADLNEFSALLTTAFLTDPTEDYLAYEKSVYEPNRSHGVFDGGTMIGCGELLTRTITLPGTGPSPVACVTSIGVAPGQRRRGVLSMVMRAQLGMLHEGGEPLLALWASEGGIYGRFGYGLATQVTRYKVPKGTAFRDGLDLGQDRVTEVSRDAALPVIRDLYDKVAPTRVGMLGRTDGSWTFHLLDKDFTRRGQTAFRFAMHPEGYAIYRARLSWEDRGPNSELTVHELVAATPRAYAALCRYLLDVDLVGEVVLRRPVDEPLVALLADPRAALRSVFDGLWVRLVDVDRGLMARHYAVPLDVVLEVSDAVCPWNAGRWRLVAGADGHAEVSRTSADADLALGVDDLGAVFLGGTRLTTLAAAGRVLELRPGAVARTALAFLHDQEPGCVEMF